MKTNINENYGLVSLSADDLTNVNGGSFWETAGYVLGVIAKTVYVFGKTGAEYQSSLPPNLKK